MYKFLLRSTETLLSCWCPAASFNFTASVYMFTKPVRARPEEWRRCARARVTDDR